jgi:hypothetical protein
MRHHLPVLAALALVLACQARGADEPTLAETSEALTTAEGKALRLAVHSGGPSIGSRGPLNGPQTRVLVLPEGVQARYDAKPRATVRLLLKIVEGGRPWDSIHAAACVQALVESPKYAALTARGASDKTWDDVIGGANPLTFREHTRQVCVMLVAAKERAAGKKE